MNGVGRLSRSGKPRPWDETIMHHRAIWIGALLLCAVGIAVAVNRALHVRDAGLRSEPVRERALAGLGIRAVDSIAYRTATAALDARFAAHPARIRAHVVAGAAFLLLAPLQFWRGLRTRHRALHRWSGRALLVLLAVAVWPGLQFGVIAPYAGPAEQTIIALVGVLALGGALRAWWAVRTGRTALHREWMLRVFALTLGISSVRLVYTILDIALVSWSVPLTTIYVASLWLGWGSTLAVTEWWIRSTRRPEGLVSQAPYDDDE